MRTTWGRRGRRDSATVSCSVVRRTPGIENPHLSGTDTSAKPADALTFDGDVYRL